MRKLLVIFLVASLFISFSPAVTASSKTPSLPETIKNQLKVMAKPPIVKLSARSAKSSIEKSIHITPVDAKGKVNNIFRYNGDAQQAGTSFPNNGFVKNIAVTTTHSNGSLTVEFDFKGAQFELYEKGQGGKYRLSVDEGNGYQFVTADAQNAAPSDGGLYHRLVKFESAKLRKIRIEYNETYFGGVIIGLNDKILAPSTPIKGKIMFFGDSFTEGGSAGAGSIQGYAPITAASLGLQGWYSGVGGTGYLNSGPKGRVTFQKRIKHDILTYKPDILVIAGGINDESFPANDVKAAAVKLYKTIQTESPDTKVFVVSGWSNKGNPPKARLEIRDALKQAALECKLPFIDVIDGITYNEEGTVLIVKGAWIVGEGNAGNPQKTGNATKYISADGTHPTKEGHAYLGERLAYEIIRIFKDNK
ncbi:SGNH/GDSL hydrolase family protein [Paenibacillus alkalitolerans]|uniref:SGNH/GDSL hydrolase family protein n=1 Tax=Paenibacillus alkalitolerans TaxID=2799335 RepID=UPI0018F3118E|nr:SGNH/GDSL hydrolase family protein [Paenibacillus alkalitolerans]